MPWDKKDVEEFTDKVSADYGSFQQDVDGKGVKGTWAYLFSKEGFGKYGKYVIAAAVVAVIALAILA